MREIFYIILIFCFIITIFSCGKTTEENVNDAVSTTNDNIEGIIEDNNDTVATDSTTNSSWTKQLGSSEIEYAYSVTTDSSGNIYVTGNTQGDLDGNTNSGGECPSLIGTISGIKILCNDIFLVKYNSSGTKQWTKLLGTSKNDFANSVTTDSSDNIYVTGYTNGDLDGNTNSGKDDIFLVKFNSSGTKQ